MRNFRENGNFLFAFAALKQNYNISGCFECEYSSFSAIFAIIQPFSLLLL